MTLPADLIGQLKQNQSRLTDLIDRFPTAKVLVVGDLTLDEFLTGQVERLSREAPVLILRHEETRQIPGGGANAVYNLAKLGGQIKAVGIVGKDDQGQALRRIFEEAGINTQGMLIDETRPTVTKSRISGHARQSVTQQIVRVDRKSDRLPDLALQQALADYIRAQLDQVDGVICSDYGDGVFRTRPDGQLSPVISAALSHKRVMVDTQKDLQRYQGATLFTPNLPEAEQAVGYSIDDDERLMQAGKDLLKMTQASHLLITRGDEGMSLFTPGKPMVHIPAFNRRQVFDVTGAGDTVIAAVSLALCVGASFWEATVLGNLAASIVVRQFGTATTQGEEMKQALADMLDNE
ncbi:D-glycero-beta-D-manno-heptose-7-phosphate kinase [Roseofilum sp. BLCC_M91]|uniref:D-glycero-beta-D-manno-heptose-7-phosphate kinase n=1 Tax=Roseofilum halophilum BLCC-M91 TaxID=3022259 RepID=A0ABT7BM53_9CYAN|nr:D-glycero-beta-D-manno-heptose-7-phosphate kinase [Roseofilum halophilum]MDJ1180251.1 D-glycero-beta-D-manno-heptose-7-phosphate kinase [Roseofilum halophilum BLCC-M91]